MYRYEHAASNMWSRRHEKIRYLFVAWLRNLNRRLPAKILKDIIYESV